MNYNIIGSSSKGNCIIVEDLLMLDVGVSYSKIKKYLKSGNYLDVLHHKTFYDKLILPST